MPSAAIDHCYFAWKRQLIREKSQNRIDSYILEYHNLTTTERIV
jgi:hypothetical protein